jgi:hypothetical protein
MQLLLTPFCGASIWGSISCHVFHAIALAAACKTIAFMQGKRFYHISTDEKPWLKDYKTLLLLSIHKRLRSLLLACKRLRTANCSNSDFHFLLHYSLSSSLGHGKTPFVEDHAVCWFGFHEGINHDTYNIGGFNEWQNIDLVKLLCKIMDEIRSWSRASEQLISYVKDRPGHDLRYAIDAKKNTSWVGSLLLLSKKDWENRNLVFRKSNLVE